MIDIPVRVYSTRYVSWYTANVLTELFAFNGNKWHDNAVQVGHHLPAHIHLSTNASINSWMMIDDTYSNSPYFIHNFSPIFAAASSTHPRIQMVVAFIQKTVLGTTNCLIQSKDFPMWFQRIRCPMVEENAILTYSIMKITLENDSSVPA